MSAKSPIPRTTTPATTGGAPWLPRGAATAPTSMTTPIAVKRRPIRDHSSEESALAPVCSATRTTALGTPAD